MILFNTLTSIVNPSNNLFNRKIPLLKLPLSTNKDKINPLLIDRLVHISRDLTNKII